MCDAEFWINHLELRPHSEGGWFAESYRSAEVIDAQALPPRFSKEHCLGTLVYFLLRAGEISRFHRLKSDEIWHYYRGTALDLHMLSEAAGLKTSVLGPDPEQGQVLQAVVPAGLWMAAVPQMGGDFSLCGCSVFPGFEFADLEFANRKELILAYPEYESLISRLCGPNEQSLDSALSR